MKHASTQALFAHWNERRGDRPAPERAEIEPAAIRATLADTFVLSFNPVTNHPFRLAGTRVCALFARELKGQPFGELFDAHRRREFADLVSIVADESVGLIAGAVGWTGEGYSIDLELLLLPLRHFGRTHVRMIGALAPLTVPYWLGASPIVTLALGSYRYAGVDAEPLAVPFPAAAASGARLRRGLMVYDGGQP
jgi:hypothetical protein